MHYLFHHPTSSTSVLSICFLQGNIYNLSFIFKPRGIHGEHSESTGEDAGVYDISNRRRLGLSEVQCVQDMYNGVKKLLEIEKAAIAYVLLILFNCFTIRKPKHTPAIV